MNSQSVVFMSFLLLAGRFGLRAALDAESSRKHSLTVRAADGQQHTDCRVTVSVLNVNEHVPHFVPDQRNFTWWLSELAVVGTVVGRLEAIDMDGDSVRYGFANSWPAESFKVDAVSNLPYALCLIYFHAINEVGSILNCFLPNGRFAHLCHCIYLYSGRFCKWTGDHAATTGFFQGFPLAVAIYSDGC